MAGNPSAQQLLLRRYTMSKFVELIAKQEAVVAAAQAKLADLIKASQAAALFDAVSVGYGASFKIGRAETRRTVDGVVRGRGLVKDVDSVRVEVGEGFSLEVYTVAIAALTGITEPAKAAPSAVAVALGEAAAGQSEADALLAELNG
jgi:hypothetical protein